MSDVSLLVGMTTKNKKCGSLHAVSRGGGGGGGRGDECTPGN